MWTVVSRVREETAATRVLTPAAAEAEAEALPDSENARIIGPDDRLATVEPEIEPLAAPLNAPSAA